MGNVYKENDEKSNTRTSCEKLKYEWLRPHYQSKENMVELKERYRESKTMYKQKRIEKSKGWRNRKEKNQPR